MPDSTNTFFLKISASARDFEAAMQRLRDTMTKASTSFAQFNRAYRGYRYLAPVAVKPALRGRRHGW